MSFKKIHGVVAISHGVRFFMDEGPMDFACSDLRKFGFSYGASTPSAKSPKDAEVLLVLEYMRYHGTSLRAAAIRYNRSYAAIWTRIKRNDVFWSEYQRIVAALN